MNDSEWGVGTSASCCLRAIAQLMKNDILELMIEYAGPYLVSIQPKDIYIGIMSLGAVLQGPDENCIKDRFQQAMSTIIDLLGNNSPKI